MNSDNISCLTAVYCFLLPWVLDKLDKYVEHKLIPAYTRGLRRSVHPPYRKLTLAASIARKAGNLEEARKLNQQAQSIPSRDPNDPNFRRLWYTRYADDFLLGVVGSKSEAVEIKQKIASFLRDELKLESYVIRKRCAVVRTNCKTYL